jgi:lipopolysaccharide transport system ATP-binding protein
LSTVIQAEGLGKKYRRGVPVDTGLRHVLDRFVRSPLSALRRTPQETFWALRDVSLEVHQGEVLGLIGRNGAGKTTLLKILSRITRPTEGRAEIRGHVGSLLEVGTGFHPELTGRENTILSGAILGMSKRQIAQKFDQIVAFAELEKFIDTPVKHYSSGMYVRLAFAVAAHLEPEILLVDEVLAVGDINFQKKCLGKMGEVAKGGRTVVLVSHQLNQVRRLCQRVVWVDGGSIHKSGAAHEVVSAYESAMARARKDADGGNGRTPGGSYKGAFTNWEIDGPTGAEPHTLTHLGPVTVKVTLKVKEPMSVTMYGMALYDRERQLVWAWSSPKLHFDVGEYQLRHTFPMLPLRPGSYSWLVALYDDWERVDLWNCEPEMAVATESHQSHLDEWHGILNIPSKFQISECVDHGRRN